MPAEGAITTALREAARLEAVTKRYGATEALAELSLTIREHEVVAVVGPSGCGKTTLLELVCGLQQPTSGDVTADPAVLMPQHDALLPWLNARDNAALPLRIADRPKEEARREADALMRAFGLEGFEHAKPQELSGGMRQRVAFVRTLLAKKPLLCLDEPFGALDAMTRAEMHAWLQHALQQQPRTVLLVTHDIEEALILADRVVVLSRRPGRVVKELAVDLDRPREPTDPEIVELRAEALAP